MSRIREHCILIDMERALTAADKKHTQAIQKAERERVEANSTNLSQQGRGPGRGEKIMAQYVSSTQLDGRSTSRTVSKQGSSAGPNRAIQRKMNLNYRVPR